MPASEPIHARLIGALFVERGLVSESQVRVALEIQRETGQQLGQVLVERFGVSRKELASVVAEQWAKLGGSSGPEDSGSWRRLGEIFVERGFVSEDELEGALTRQRQTGERLGEALVAQGVISKFELAGALAEQMAMLEATSTEDAPAEQPEATVHHLPARFPEESEIPFGTVVEIAPAEEPEAQAEDDAAEPDVPHVWADVEEVTPEPEPAAADVEELALEVEPVAADVEELVLEVEPVAAEVEELVLEVEPVAEEVRPEGVPDDFISETADATPEPGDAIAIDDVGHVSLVGALAAPVALEPSEAEPAPLYDELRDAIFADASSVDEPEVECLPSIACLAFAPTADGYRLVTLERLPEPGETIAVPDVGERLVLRVGRSPIPGDGRMCAYVEEPVSPAPVAALAS